MTVVELYNVSDEWYESSVVRLYLEDWTLLHHSISMYELLDKYGNYTVVSFREHELRIEKGEGINS